MDILQINTEKTWRGGERQTFFLMKGLMKAGLHVKLLCLKGRPLEQICLKHSLPVISVNDQKHAFRYLLKYGGNYDLLHAQTGKGQSLAIMAKPLHRCPVVYTRRVDFRPSNILSKLKYRFTDQVVAISPAIKNILSNVMPLEDIAVIPSCIDTSRESLEPSAKALSVRAKLPDCKIFGTIAALVPHKDPLTMVKAVDKLSGISDKKFVFLHFGQGELEAEVKEEINRRGLDDIYLLMGFDEEVERFYPIMDGFVMSSREEGLGSSVLDAFRYKVPVAATDAGGLRFLVTTRGLVSSAENPEKLAENMKFLLESSQKVQEMVARAHEYVLLEHGLDSMINDYLKIYEKVLRMPIDHDCHKGS
ncbi:glycosyltransferase family 4 protein [Desulfonatronovibrio magnus]|uniref:glycosyltransferase family 4 protein n=1 Tax=Desulfonatronovibrio magnus TaxID=698827 RepID=UPI0005EAD89A|nr:glycosyltransferase family 4 protein [Desulfonatronovibrio magnus]